MVSPATHALNPTLLFKVRVTPREEKRLIPTLGGMGRTGTACQAGIPPVVASHPCGVSPASPRIPPRANSYS